MARPRRARITRAQVIDESRLVAVGQILDALKEYLPDAAKALGQAAKMSDVQAATTIVKFIADNAPGAGYDTARNILADIATLRGKGLDLAVEEGIPEDFDVEAELEGATSNAGTDPKHKDLG